MSETYVRVGHSIGSFGYVVAGLLAVTGLIGLRKGNGRQDYLITGLILALWFAAVTLVGGPYELASSGYGLRRRLYSLTASVGWGKLVLAPYSSSFSLLAKVSTPSSPAHWIGATGLNSDQSAWYFGTERKTGACLGNHSSWMRQFGLTTGSRTSQVCGTAPIQARLRSQPFGRKTFSGGPDGFITGNVLAARIARWAKVPMPQPG